MEICKKTIDVYCESSIDRIKKTHFEEVNELYGVFPYEKYGERFINKALSQLGVGSNDYEYTECMDAGMMAYMYCIHRFAVIKCVYTNAYLNKVIKIYVKCALVVCRESRNICKKHNFKLIELDNIDNTDKF